MNTYTIYIDGRVAGTVIAPNLREADRLAVVKYGNAARARIS